MRGWAARGMGKTAMWLLAAGVLASVGSARAQTGKAPMEDWEAAEFGGMMGAAEAAKLEAALGTDPDNRDTRARLLSYYANASAREPAGANRRKFVAQMMWFIDHAPDSWVLRSRTIHFQMSDFPPMGPEDYKGVITGWDRAISQHPGNVAILRNAVLSLFGIPVSVHYGMELRAADPYDPDGVVPAAVALGAILDVVQKAPGGTTHMEGLAKLAAVTVSTFETLPDAALIGTTGKALVDRSGGKDGPSMRQGRHFLERARTLDPGNPKWGAALAETPTVLAPGENEVARLYKWLEEEDLWRGRVVPPVALPGKPVAIAPDVAWQRQYLRIFGQDIDVSRITGTHKSAAAEMDSEFDGEVRLELLVDAQGKIVRVEPLSGDAEHIEIALGDVERWRFRPWLVEGQPVAFQTVMPIRFTKRLWNGGVAGLAGLAKMGAAGGVPGGGGLLLNGGERLSGETPVYPAVARAAHVSGVVEVGATLTAEGRLANLRVKSGPGLLQQAALDAVSTWRFKPVLREARAVAVETTIRVVFTIGDR